MPTPSPLLKQFIASCRKICTINKEKDCFGDLSFRKSFPKEYVGNVCEMMDRLEVKDFIPFGLSFPNSLKSQELIQGAKSQFENLYLKKRSGMIRFISIVECSDFTMGIFVLPAGGCIPLHDHPQMTVFSKLLFGSVHIKAYNWIENGKTTNRGQALPAQMETDTTISGPAPTRVLFPMSGGNIHSFHAINETALFDLLVPPYSTERPCQYYKEVLGDEPIPSETDRKNEQTEKNDKESSQWNNRLETADKGTNSISGTETWIHWLQPIPPPSEFVCYSDN